MKTTANVPINWLSESARFIASARFDQVAVAGHRCHAALQRLK